MARLQLIDEVADAVRGLRIGNTTISIAESCTGGLISHKLTNIRGISDLFLMGIVAYSNEVKKLVLKVKKETIDRFGAASAEVAREMAEGIATLSNSDIGVSITGFADGEKAGEVYLGIHERRGKRTIVKRLDLRGGRAEVKEQAAMMAIEEISRLTRTPADDGDGRTGDA